MPKYLVFSGDLEDRVEDAANPKAAACKFAYMQKQGATFYTVIEVAPMIDNDRADMTKCITFKTRLILQYLGFNIEEK